MIYPLQLFNGHAIVHTQNDVILLDTGAPMSLHNNSQFHFEETLHRCNSGLRGVTTGSISELLGMDITALMGADVLSRYHVLLDYRNLQAKFSTDPIVFEGRTIGLESFMGIPIIKLTISGNEHRFFLDTGAQYSYVSEQLIRTFPPAGEVQDFYPGVGQFQISCHDVELMLGADVFNARCGNPPALVQQMLTMGNCQGIIGADLFNNFKVQLNLAGRQMRYIPNV
jgi:hypothetical protein